MPLLTPTQIAEAKHTPIEAVIGLDYTLKEVGNRFQSEEHPALQASKRLNTWCWFSHQPEVLDGRRAGKDVLGGDTITWRMYEHHESFPEAVRALTGEIPMLPAIKREAVKPAPKTYKTWGEDGEKLVDFANTELWTSTEGLKCWAEHNMFADDIHSCELGWLPEFEYWDDEQRHTCPAGVIPYRDFDGNLVGIQVRLFTQETSQRYRPLRSGYRLVPYAPMNLGEDAVIVEGFKKSRILSRNGIPAIGLPSVTAFSACGLETLIREKRIKRLYLALDPGLHKQGGRPLHHREIGWVKTLASEIELRLVQLPLKPDDYLAECGAPSLQAVLRSTPIFRP